MAGVGTAVTSAPAKATRPADARQRPMIVRRVEVFPAPFRPSSMVTPRSGTTRSTPCRM